MRVVTERRRVEAVKLRAYVAAIKQAESTTDEEWADAWVEGCRTNPDSPYVPRAVWIGVLKNWALEEAEKLSISEAA